MLIAFYADDFTGSTDALEALTNNGIETVLFVRPPSKEILRRYPNVRAFGIAGDSRTMSPTEMNAHLSDVFRALQQLRPKIVHYKLCSTFDSSPDVGSIGAAIEIGDGIFQNRVVPLLVAAPSLQRFCVFGNLFARSGLNSVVFRLDRHPTMKYHPITPMTESDLREHLARQTTRPISLVDVLTLDKGYDASFADVSDVVNDGGILLFDTLTDEHLALAGQLIGSLQEQEGKALFVAGSSGVEYALVKYWRSINLISGVGAKSQTLASAPTSVDRILVVSGSCSPVAGRQINWGLEHGFEEIRLDPFARCSSNRPHADETSLSQQITSTLNAGQSAIVHSCCGPTDPRFGAIESSIASADSPISQLGAMLGRAIREVVRSHAVKRVAVFGGDTSGYVAGSLGIDALEYIGPLEPGAPLCRARSQDEAVDGLEIVFKGGQVGYDDFLGAVLRGRSDRCVFGGTK